MKNLCLPAFGGHIPTVHVQIKVNFLEQYVLYSLILLFDSKYIYPGTNEFWSDEYTWNENTARYSIALLKQQYG